MSIFDTIVAEATAPYESALSIVRVSGPDTKDILCRLTKKELSKFTPRMVHLVTLYGDKGQEIDQATLVYNQNPNSYTGEDTLELYTHGSRIIVDELIETIISYGARRAEGGEFTAKAYYNGKMNLIEAESVNELIKAKTYKGKEIALKTLKGTNYNRIERVRQKLLDIMARIEVDIDYPEYDDTDEIIYNLKLELPELNKTVSSLRTDSRASLYYLNGIKVALVGEPNVGKSTLLNAILGYDKAIVTAIPGTTRDVVEGEKMVDGMLYRFLDTAGIRENPDQIEKIGIEYSYRTIQEADVICYVFEHFNKGEFDVLDLPKDKPCILVQNKIDKNPRCEEADIHISALEKDLGLLMDNIKKSLNIQDTIQGVFSSKRDLDLLDSFGKMLELAANDLNNGVTIDVIEILLVKATKILDELLGNEQTLEDLYSTVFKSFCVGK